MPANPPFMTLNDTFILRLCVKLLYTLQNIAHLKIYVNDIFKFLELYENTILP